MHIQEIDSNKKQDNFEIVKYFKRQPYASKSIEDLKCKNTYGSVIYRMFNNFFKEKFFSYQIDNQNWLYQSCGIDSPSYIIKKIEDLYMYDIYGYRVLVYNDQADKSQIMDAKNSNLWDEKNGEVLVQKLVLLDQGGFITNENCSVALVDIMKVKDLDGETHKSFIEDKLMINFLCTRDYNYDQFIFRTFKQNDYFFQDLSISFIRDKFSDEFYPGSPQQNSAIFSVEKNYKKRSSDNTVDANNKTDLSEFIIQRGVDRPAMKGLSKNTGETNMDNVIVERRDRPGPKKLKRAAVHEEVNNKTEAENEYATDLMNNLSAHGNNLSNLSIISDFKSYPHDHLNIVDCVNSNGQISCNFTRNPQSSLTGQERFGQANISIIPFFIGVGLLASVLFCGISKFFCSKKKTNKSQGFSVLPTKDEGSNKRRPIVKNRDDKASLESATLVESKEFDDLVSRGHQKADSSGNFKIESFDEIKGFSERAVNS